MVKFELMDFLKPKEWLDNFQWVVGGAVIGVLLYNWLSTGPVAPAGAYVAPAPSMNVGAYGPQPMQTKTYGCADCGQTASIGMASPTNEPVTMF